MADILIDGAAYKLINGCCPDRQRAVDLVGGNRVGPLKGYQPKNSNDQIWTVRKVNGSPNEVILENATAGTYAVAASNDQNQPIVGNANPKQWTLYPVANNKFQIKAGDVAWELQGCDDDAEIVLKAPRAGEAVQQWSFQLQAAA